MNDLQVGDQIARPKIQGVVDHVGVVVGHDRVLHNTPSRGEHESTYREFAASQRVRRIGRVKSYREAQGVVARGAAILRAPKAWSLLNNCEVTVARALGLPPQSKQLVGWSLFFAVVGVALLTARK